MSQGQKIDNKFYLGNTYLSKARYIKLSNHLILFYDTEIQNIFLFGMNIFKTCAGTN